MWRRVANPAPDDVAESPRFYCLQKILRPPIVRGCLQYVTVEGARWVYSGCTRDGMCFAQPPKSAVTKTSNANQVSGTNPELNKEILSNRFRQDVHSTFVPNSRTRLPPNHFSKNLEPIVNLITVAYSLFPHRQCTRHVWRRGCLREPASGKQSAPLLRSGAGLL